ALVQGSRLARNGQWDSGVHGCLLDPDRTAPSTADEAARQFTERQVSMWMRPIGPCAPMTRLRRNRSLAALEKPSRFAISDRPRRGSADSGATHAIERCETSGQDVGQILSVSCRLPVFAKRDERHVCPELLLQIDADPLLLLQIGRV